MSSKAAPYLLLVLCEHRHKTHTTNKATVYSMTVRKKVATADMDMPSEVELIPGSALVLDTNMGRGVVLLPISSSRMVTITAPFRTVTSWWFAASSIVKSSFPSTSLSVSTPTKKQCFCLAICEANSITRQFPATKSSLSMKE